VTFTVGGAGVSDGYLAKMSQTIDSDTWTVEFDDHLSSVTDASGGTTSFEWTGDDITRITPPAGKTTTVGYDASNRVTQVVRDHWTGGYTATTELAYSSANNRLEVTVTDPNDHETIYRGDAFGKIDDVTDVLGHKRSTTYSPNNDVATAVDAQSAANTTTYSYSDAAGGYTPTGTTAPPGASTTASYASTPTTPRPGKPPVPVAANPARPARRPTDGATSPLSSTTRPATW
jgi:uncharacterized protein RhaS with RHS repeats